MRTFVRRSVAAVLIIHGALHVLGDGLAWTVAAGVLVASGVLLLFDQRQWWRLGAVGVALSQIVVVADWHVAWAGTIVNVVLMAAVVHGMRCEGRGSLRSEYRRLSKVAVVDEPRPPVTELDLLRLPQVVAGHVRRSGAVGAPHVTGFRAAIHGRIRAGAESPWMPFRGEQVNTVGATSTRLFLIDATMKGLPTDVFHSFVDDRARMQVRVAGVVPVVDAVGPEMDRSETVTLFNDMCVLSPAALVDAPITWDEIDAHHVMGRFTRGAETVSAELVFDDAGDLVDFISDDRSRASSDGTEFELQRWSTPLSGYRRMGGRRLSTVGEGRWHAPEGEYAYLEFHVDDIAYRESPLADAA